jgi:folate-dependent tRNA-U54 methylase TrmFO/GidA
MDDTENTLTDQLADDESVELKENENVVEIHIISATITAPGFKTEVETFVTLDFYDFGTAVSPVISGLRPLYNYVSR